MHVNDLYTAEEMETSSTYNEFLVRTDQQDSLNVRLDGPDGSHITWGGALPAPGAAAVSGSMLLRRSAVSPPFVVHVKPVGVRQPDYGARRWC